MPSLSFPPSSSVKSSGTRRNTQRTMTSHKLKFRLPSCFSSMSFISPKRNSFYSANFLCSNQPVFPFAYYTFKDLNTITKSMTTQTSYGPVEANLTGGLPDFSSDLDLSKLEKMINVSSKWLVAVLLLLVLLWRNDTEAMWAASGCVPNAWLSVILKRIFKQERPFPNIKSGPGMPSSHAQFIFYSFNFIVLSVVQFLGISQDTMAYGAMTFALGYYLSWLRVSQGFHTFSQVLAGAVVGNIFSVLWFKAWNSFILEAMLSCIWVRILMVLGSTMTYVCFLCQIGKHTA